MQKAERFLNLVDEYLREIDNDSKQADYIISKVGKFDSELVDDIYQSAILRMCIKYESFTADAYSILIEDRNVKYNHPWAYTRQIAEALGIDIYNEYKTANDCWDIYNSLKHVNYKTKLEEARIADRYNLSNYQEMCRFICNTLINLLKALKKGIN